MKKIKSKLGLNNATPDPAQ